MLPNTAFLFAAGLGTRMRPLTLTRPKPLIEVAGIPLFDHALARVGQCKTVIANTHYKAEQMRAHLKIRNVIESHEPKLLDMGGGLKQGLYEVESDGVITANTDAVWTGAEPLDTLAAGWDTDQMDALLVLVPTNAASAHTGGGDFSLDRDGRLVPGLDFVYTGLQCIKTAPIHATEGTAFPIYPIWQQMQAQNRLFGVVHDGGWCDVGRPESLPIAEALLAEANV